DDNDDDDENDEEEELAKNNDEETESGKGGDDVNESEGETDKEETRQEEDGSFDPIPRTPEGIQIQTDRLQDSLQRENDEFLRNIDENMKKIIKGQVKNQVKEQVSRILPRIEEFVNATLEDEVLTRSSHSSRTSYAIAADLSEMELKKILIEKMEGNKSTKGSQSRQLSASEFAFAEEPVQTTCQMEEPPHPVFEIVNRESALDVYSKRRIIVVTELKILEWHDYKHLDWISIGRDDHQIYKFKEGDFKRLRLQDIEDMLLLLVQGKLSNLTVEEHREWKTFNWELKATRRGSTLRKPDTYCRDLKRREVYTAHSNPRGFIYQNKDKKNRLERIDELHKFNDGTLNDVRNALDDRLKGIRMQYLPTTIWRRGDKDRAATMIQAIKKMLKTRRIMRSLEKFVGRRL
nr:hypothetical protein [Tanacetum cinerariifolium]